MRQRTQLTGPNRPNDSNPTLKRRANATRNHAQQSSTHRGAQRLPQHTPHPAPSKTMRQHQNLPPRRCANKRASRGTPRRNRRGEPAIEADAGARHRSRCGGLRQPGGHGGGTAPDPIPNSDVKPTSAYDTAPQGAGKSVAARSSEPPPPQPHRPTHTHTPCRGVEQPGSSSGS